jgi:hypothetical protein
LTQRFRALLKAHNDCAKAESSQKEKFLDRLLRCHRANRNRWATTQKTTADDFNLFEVMEVEHNEACHSKLLAWLLDRRIEYGTHSQGNRGFRLFIKEFGRELGVEVNPQVKTYYKDDSYWVFREVSSNESRVDIEIASQKKFIIHIENKILAAEGKDQTKREWQDLYERGKQLQIPEKNCHALFLTVDGNQPQSKDFRPIVWNRIAKVLDKFAKSAKPRDVRLFARHYAAAVRKLAVTEPEAMEIEHAEAMAQWPPAMSAETVDGREGARRYDGRGAREIQRNTRQGTRKGARETRRLGSP